MIHFYLSYCSRTALWTSMFLLMQFSMRVNSCLDTGAACVVERRMRLRHSSFTSR